MATLSMLDTIVVVIVLLMGLKGLFNGLIKELMSLIGLIVGIFFASRFSNAMAHFIGENQILPIEDHSLLKLIGFVIVLVLIWVGAIALGAVLDHRREEEPRTVIGRVLGFVVGCVKYFVILSLIITAFSNIQFIQDNFKKHIEKSVLYPHLNSTGSMLLDLPTSEKSGVSEGQK
jgi:membrane protein required for colicin V production